MQKYKDPKEMRWAMNGRMITMLSGVFIIVTALFTTLRYAIGLFQSANEAAKGVEEYLAAVEQAGISIGYLRFVAAYLLLTTILEVFVGVFSVRLANRLDKSKLCMKLCIALIVVEVILQPVVLPTQMLMISNVLMPLCLLWGVSQLRKLSKIYPDRIFAVDTNQANRKKQEVKPQNKNLMARAMATIQEAPEKRTEENSEDKSEENSQDKSEENALEIQEKSENTDVQEQ